MPPRREASGDRTGPPGPAAVPRTAGQERTRRRSPSPDAAAVRGAVTRVLATASPRVVRELMNERLKDGFLRLRQSGEDSGEILSRFAANEPRFGVQRRAVGAHERQREHQIESRRQRVSGVGVPLRRLAVPPQPPGQVTTGRRGVCGVRVAPPPALPLKRDPQAAGRRTPASRRAARRSRAPAPCSA